MCQPVTLTNPSATFLLRFWRETTADEVRWRGQIKHVQSGESVAFLELEAILDFLRRFGIAMKDPNQPPETVLP